MVLAKTESDEKIEIVGEFKTLQIRATVRVTDDGEVISESYHRRSIPPGQDASDETEEIKALVTLYHTPEIIEAYRQWMIDQMPPQLEGADDAK